MIYLKYIFKIILALLALVSLIVAFAPWESWVEGWVSQRLKAQGIPLEALELQKIGLTHADFTGVVIDIGQQLVIPTLRVEYTKENLLDKKIDHLELRGIDYAITLPMADNNNAAEQGFSMPAVDVLRQLPIEQITVAKSRLSVESEDFILVAPFEAELSKNQMEQVKLEGKNAELILNGQGKVLVQQWGVALSPVEEVWQAAINVPDISVRIEQKTKPSSKGANQKTALPKLPVIENLQLVKLSVPSIQVDYKEGENTKVSTSLGAQLEKNRNSIKLQSKSPTQISLPEVNAQIPEWTGSLLWPDGQVQLANLVAIGTSVAIKSKGKSGETTYPMPNQFMHLPIGKVTLEKARLDSQFSGGSLSTNFSATLNFSDGLAANLNSKAAELKLGKESYFFDNLRGELSSSRGQWRFTLRSSKFYNPKTKGEVAWLPLGLTMNGTIKPKSVDANVSAKHEDFTLKSGVSYKGGGAVLVQPVITVAGGNVSAARIDLSQKEISADLKFHEVSLEELLQLILKDNKSVQATGKLSGNVPVFFNDGNIRIGSGILKSATPGFLSIGEQHLAMLPQTVEQVNNVTELLKHFEYYTLALQTEEKEKKLAVLVALKGKNPKVYEGAEVHLNINLRGDVLETISSALGLVDLPERYMKGNR